MKIKANNKAFKLKKISGHKNKKNKLIPYKIKQLDL